MKRNIVLLIIILLAIIGVADSSYALRQHYAPPQSSSCDINETVSCTAVNQSEYSLLLGVPVAGIGIGGYLLIAVLAIAMRSGRRLYCWLLLTIAIIALAFSSWLTWVEIFSLDAICPLCVVSLTLIILITGLAVYTLITTNEGRC